MRWKRKDVAATWRTGAAAAIKAGRGRGRRHPHAGAGGALPGGGPAAGAALGIPGSDGGGYAAGTVNPDSFTHGGCTQRVRWFRIGLESGALERCDPFAVKTA